MRGFYEEYQKERQSGGMARDRPAVIRRGAVAAALGFASKLAAAVLYSIAAALGGVGLTTLINKPLRDMLFELAKNVFFGN